MSNHNLIYLDHSSTSPLSEDVLETINNTFKYYWGNVSSTYNLGIQCSLELEKIRNKIATKFNASSNDVVFTSGSTESISLVFNKILDSFNPASITISAVEHQATIIASNRLKKYNWKISQWPVNNEGIVQISEINKYINNETKLVSIIWGQSEIGTLQPIQKIGKRCNDCGTFFHVDGTQILTNGIFNWNQLNCDFLSFSAHKFGGPKGVGILLIKEKAREFLKNKDISINQENSIRAGTQALPLISGIYPALNNIKGKIILTDNELIFNSKKVSKLSEYLLNKLKLNNKIEITGSIEKRLPNHLSFILLNNKFKPIKAYKVINFMSDNNIAISSGSACSSSSNKPSNILSSIGIEKNRLYSNIRLSFNEQNTKDQIDKFYELILKSIDIF